MSRTAVTREMWSYLRMRKKFWLVPLVVTLLIFGTIIVLAESSVLAPFIYTLF